MDFKALQQKWYAILREAGFDDIEADHHSFGELNKYYGRMNPIRRYAREEYYRLINLAIADESVKFKSETDQYIMRRHAEGAKISSIVDELEKGELEPRNRQSVRIIIRRYEMAWDIRHYTRRQLRKFG